MAEPDAIAKRAELFPSIELAAEIEALKAQLAVVVGGTRSNSTQPGRLEKPPGVARWLAGQLAD